MYIALTSDLSLPYDDRTNSGFDANLKGAVIRAGASQTDIPGRWASCNEEFRIIE